MNKTERAKVTALQDCRLAFTGDDIPFVRSMAWARDHDAKRVLSPRQKWALDVLVYKYRRQLGGRWAGFDIPSSPPVAADYGVAEPKVTQRNIFGGEDKPRPTPVEPLDYHPPRRLL